MRAGRDRSICSYQFYEEYPKIVHARGRLTWTHIKALLTITEKAPPFIYMLLIDGQSVIFYHFPHGRL